MTHHSIAAITMFIASLPLFKIAPKIDRDFEMRFIPSTFLPGAGCKTCLEFKGGGKSPPFVL